MNIEDRLRAELERAGRSTKVGVAPSVATLSAVASQRRNRNRIVGAASAFVVAGFVVAGAYVANSPDDVTLVVADNGADIDAQDDTSAAAVAPESGSSAADASVSGETAEQGSAEAAPSDAIASADGGQDADESTVDNQSAVAEPTDSLQVDASPLTVATRNSAIEFAGGSGVLLVPFERGFRGLAASFGDGGARAIGITSVNGLDWAESRLTGVPDGATATVLHEYNGSYVALFDHFDVDSGQRSVYVGVSNDLVAWDLADALEGRDVVATDLAVGSPGVIVIGDDFAPNVWIGPVGGPYELKGRVDATSLAGVTTLDEQFLVAGRSPELGITLFSTTDGEAWGARQLSSADAVGANQTVVIAEGTIVLTTVTDNGQVTQLSSDGGRTWNRLSNDPVRSLSVSRSALGFIGGSGSGATVTLSSGNSMASAHLDVAVPDRLSLLAATSDEVVMLVSDENGGLTWVVASR